MDYSLNTRSCQGIRRPFAHLAAAVMLVGCCLVFGGPLTVRGEEGGVPRTFVLDLDFLSASKQAWQNGHPVMKSEVDRLKRFAEGALSRGPYSVTFTPAVAPSGDPHDLVSYGYYWWPNPNTPDGVPWIFRDGVGNPDAVMDWDQISGMSGALQSLGLGYYFTGDERYAERAAFLLRTFFLDEETRMNPRILYSNIIPGVHAGSFGVPGVGNAIGTQHLIDAAGLIEASPHWTAKDREGLQAWTHEMAEWALTSMHGVAERNNLANHGTNFDFVTSIFGLYNGDLKMATDNYNYFVKRIPVQLLPDGSNPLEERRADSLLYSRYNLSRSLDIAALGKQMDVVDLFEYETEDGRGLKKAIDFLAPYFVGEAEWDRWPGRPFPKEVKEVYYELLRRSAALFRDPALLDKAYQLGDLSVSFVDLTYPESAVYQDYFVGDANLDGVFNETDLIQVFQAGKYEANSRAYWKDGDWNADRRFNSTDLIFASQQGHYNRAVTIVPEPSCSWTLLYLYVAFRSTAARRRWVDGRRSTDRGSIGPKIVACHRAK